MAIRDRIYRALVSRGLRRDVDFSRFALTEGGAREAASRCEGDLAQLFWSHDGRRVHKWLHYLEAYERYLARFRGRQVKMLELGVFDGGSLELWRKYLGENATIFGIDINPACADRVDAPNQVRIGSQADGSFLKRVVAEMGGVDVVLDDGSHFCEHQIASLEALFPLLNEGGVYIIEDMHTAYWPEWQGGYGYSGSAIEYLKRTIDDMHGTYHTKGSRTVAGMDAHSIQFFDSMVFIEKRKKQAPKAHGVPHHRPVPTAM